MAISIKDIARLAGVSHSTVSRALHRSPLIPAKTAERIRKIALAHGYTASAVARSLVTRKTRTLGVVVTSIADPFNGEVVTGIEEVANQHGYSVILATSQADPKREMDVVRSFQERRTDGIVVASSRVGALHLSHLSTMKVPIVLLNNQHPSEFVHSVTIDNVDGAYQAVRHLIELGHRKIAYIGDRFGLQSDTERCQGYRKALRRARVPFDPQLVEAGDGKSEGGSEAAARLLSGAHRPTAIFCYNDMTALGVLKEAARAKLRIPQDLSVVGFDDIFFAPLLHPPLTTFCQPKREMGRQAANQVLNLLGGRNAPKIVVVKGELLVRGSTAEPPATSRPEPERTRRPGLRSKA